ncbi:sn-glycerol-3-phosphate ABC transporter ATP-binding protein UgpC [Candidatus Pelagibacter sp.]|jgi:ABC-type sugar transport system ATPase subunit|nr:sn-glycerol-3-phosphate ABC transporter ATP-binding protein UgpC [Candidatus Pelagibacter sp.]
MANIKFNNIHKSFGSNKIITDFNLLGNDNEFLVLVGPSGCGKSTLLRMIAGLEKIDEGEIYINDQKINDLHPSKRQTAMVFQTYALYPHMNVYENMSFGLKIEKRPKEEIEQKVMHAAKILQIEELLERKPKQLSGGQRQRVAIGRAITRNPKIFLFDEPLSNLDAALRAEMRVEISKLHKKIKTNMIYVTHDQVEAMTLADRIVILNLGNIEQVGTPDEIYRDPSNIFVAQFIGTPKMNILKVTSDNVVSGNEINFLGNKVKINGINFSKKDYYFGIRPEHFSFSEDNEYKFNPKVDLIENLGNEKIAYIKIDQFEISAKIPSHQNIENIIGFNSKDIFVFDEKGKRIKS